MDNSGIVSYRPFETRAEADWIQVCVDHRPSDRNVRRWPLLLFSDGRYRSAVGKRCSFGRRDRQTDERTDGHHSDALMLPARSGQRLASLRGRLIEYQLRLG